MWLKAVLLQERGSSSPTYPLVQVSRISSKEFQSQRLLLQMDKTVTHTAICLRSCTWAIQGKVRHRDKGWFWLLCGTNVKSLFPLHVSVYFETYGCQMNVNDTEIAWSILQRKGYQRTADLSEVWQSSFFTPFEHCLCQNSSLTEWLWFQADVVLLVTCSIR